MLQTVTNWHKQMPVATPTVATPIFGLAGEKGAEFNTVLYIQWSLTKQYNHTSEEFMTVKFIFVH